MISVKQLKAQLMEKVGELEVTDRQTVTKMDKTISNLLYHNSMPFDPGIEHDINCAVQMLKINADKGFLEDVVVRRLFSMFDKVSNDRKKICPMLLDFFSDYVVDCVNKYKGSSCLERVVESISFRLLSERKNPSIKSYAYTISRSKVVEEVKQDSGVGNILLNFAAWYSHEDTLKLAETLNKYSLLKDNSDWLYFGVISKVKNIVNGSAVVRSDFDKIDNFLKAIYDDKITSKIEQYQLLENFSEITDVEIIDVAYATGNADAVISLFDVLNSSKQYNSSKAIIDVAEGDEINTKVVDTVVKVSEKTLSADCVMSVSRLLQHYLREDFSDDCSENSSNDNSSFGSNDDSSLDSLEKMDLASGSILATLEDPKPDMVVLKNRDPPEFYINKLNVVLESIKEFSNNPDFDTVAENLEYVAEYDSGDGELLKNVSDMLLAYKDSNLLFEVGDLIRMGDKRNGNKNQHLIKLLSQGLKSYATSEISQDVVESLQGLFVDSVKLENYLRSLLDDDIKSYLEENYLDVDETLDLIKHSGIRFNEQGINSFKDYLQDYKRLFGEDSSNPTLYSKYYQRIFFNIEDRDFCKDLTLRDVERLTACYSLITSTCKEWPQRNKEIVIESFFNRLNSNLSTGPSVSDKKKILTEYCNNVSKMIIDDVAGLHFIQSDDQNMKQYMPVVVA